MKILLICTLLIVFSGISLAQGSWERKSDFPDLRWGATAFTLGNYGYIGTGVSNDTARNDFWRYDPENDSWQQVASMPTLGRFGAFSFSIGDKGYVGSGTNSLILSDFEFWSYNPKLDRWEKRKDVPWMVYTNESLASFSIQGKGYLFCAVNQYNFKEYDPLTDSWTNKANCPLNHVMDLAGFSIGNKGFLVAGYDGDLYRDSKQFWEYDPAFDRWTRKKDFPSPRVNCAALTIGSLGYVGLGVSKGTFLSDFWEYNPATDNWTLLDDCPYLSTELVAYAIGSKGYFGTGVSNDGKQIWEYTAESSSDNHINISDKMIVYPNPATDILGLGTSFNETARYEILNFEGMTIDHGQIRGKSIQISSLPAGSYILKCIRFNGETLCGKFIKQ